MEFVYDETIWNIVIQTFTGAQFLPCLCNSVKTGPFECQNPENTRVNS